MATNFRDFNRLLTRSFRETANKQTNRNVLFQFRSSRCHGSSTTLCAASSSIGVTMAFILNAAGSGQFWTNFYQERGLISVYWNEEKNC